jgi:Glycosyltransferase family 87
VQLIIANGMQPHRSSLLANKRLRAHGLILALSLWSVYVWNMATPGILDRAHNLKGTDFLHFYTLGWLARSHAGSDLYNMEAQADIAARLVPAAAGIRFLPLYPPQVSLFFAPFAGLPYSGALIVWLALNTLIYGACCYAMWRACPNLPDQKITVLILTLAFPAFWHLIAWGQTSALALAIFTLAFFALRARFQFLAGLALGCLVFKPQLGLAAAIVFLITLNWKVVLGAVLSAVAQIGTGWLYFGPNPPREWIRQLLNLRALLPLMEPRLYQTHSLRTFWSMLLPWPSAALALYLTSALLIAILAVVCWRSRLPLSVRYSVLLFATVLLAPHLTVYDLVILAPAFLLLSDWLIVELDHRSANHLAVLLYFAFLLPLIGPLARWTHFQPSVPVMAAIMYLLGSRRSFNPMRNEST